jgi:hypothetical protein
MLSTQPDTPPPFYTLYKYIPLYLFTQEGGRLSEKVEGALVHKRGREYQHDLLYLQSTNYIKHQ